MSRCNDLKRPFCVDGCGRNVNAASGRCVYCAAGRPPPLPKPSLLPLDYLVGCIAELERRQSQMASALASVKAPAGLRSVR